MVASTGNSALHNPQMGWYNTQLYMNMNHPQRVTRSRVTVVMGYVPDGLSKKQYEEIKRKDAAAKRANLDRVGQNRFQSRSFDAFHKALENGEAGHLFPVDPNDYKKGKIKYEDIPYMQRRGGAWDNSDIKGVMRLKRNVYDNTDENRMRNITKYKRRGVGLFRRIVFR